jgi:ubiquilin
VKGPSELKLSITISPSKSVSDLKDVIAEKSEVPKDRQRLIYSGQLPYSPDSIRADFVIGKVLKDEDPISQYKIQVSGNVSSCSNMEVLIYGLERTHFTHGQGCC